MSTRHSKLFFLLALFCAVAVYPRTLHAAEIYVAPASGTYAVGSTFSVTVKVNTEGKAINTGEITAEYSSDTLELLSASQGTTFTLPTPGSPRTSASAVYFGGGVPNPGYTGAGGELGRLTFRVRKSGTGSITLSEGKALLNDGFGTDVFTRALGARFTLTSASGAAPVAGVVPVVSSKTHPLQDHWYSNADPVFSWKMPPKGDAVSFELDSAKDTVPDRIAETADGAEYAYTAVPDGIWYFHIRARIDGSFGPAAHYRAQVDTAPPEKFALAVSSDIQGVPTISFETTDALSGVARYALVVDGDTVEEKASSPVTLSSLSRGRHTISVLAYDHAGNAATAKTSLFVDKSVMISLSLIMVLVLFNILITILLLVILWFEINERKRHAPMSERVRRAEREIEGELEKLHARVSEQISTISEFRAKDLVSRQKTLEEDLGKVLSETKKSVSATMVELGDVSKKEGA